MWACVGKCANLSFPREKFLVYGTECVLEDWLSLMTQHPYLTAVCSVCSGVGFSSAETQCVNTMCKHKQTLQHVFSGIPEAHNLSCQVNREEAEVGKVVN